MSTTKTESTKRKLQSESTSFHPYNRPMIGNNHTIQPNWIQVPIPIRHSLFHPFMSPGRYQPVMPIQHPGPVPMLWNRGMGPRVNLNYFPNGQHPVLFPPLNQKSPATNATKAKSGPRPNILKKASPAKKSVTTIWNVGPNQAESSPSSSSSDSSFKFDDPQSGDSDEIIELHDSPDETTTDNRGKDSPPLKHMVVLNRLIKERLQSSGTIARVSECRLCGSFSCGTDNTRTISTFMRSHLYTHVPTVFSCAVCVTYKANTMSRMKHHLRKFHGKDAAARAGSVLDSRYEIDDKLVDLAVRCFSNSVIQIAPKQ